ncbi:sensor histidine kinase [Amycolatopsis nigrescens]|uniref:sensor histidine kinase n=1 Tax=Amycolatopsis nigrescens TaxID=381445 RepID=UPI0003763830|nr:histidine kinase [Amycolatopsis nigrescens]
MDRSRSPRRAWLRGAPAYALDAGLAIFWFTVYLGFANSSSLDGSVGFTGPDWLGALVAVAVALPVALRRLCPLPALALTVAGCVAAALLHITREPFTAVAFVLYMVGVRETPRRSVPALVVTLLTATTGLVVSFRLDSALMDGPENYTVIVCLWCAIGWGAGFIMRVRRAETARSAQRLAEQALTDERLRIARELHDIVAHSMSLIAVKAAVGNHVAVQRPEEARDALRVIEDTSRGALTDLRRMLGVLRSGMDGDEESAELDPAPGPAGLPALAELAEIGGVRVELTVRGLSSLSEGVGLAVYRIVQESLTNVVKHAAPATCRVSVEAGQEAVRIEVTDSGSGGTGGTGTQPPGHGLIGMRERVLTYGGEFTAGPLPTGGFRVLATLPYEPQPKEISG